MNHVCLMGRLTRDPETRYTQGGLCVARYSLAIDRPGKEKATDFINCVAFGKAGEFAEKYLHKGEKIAVEGRIQTGSYEKDGKKTYTFDVVVNAHHFCEGKGEKAKPDDDFVNIPEGVTDEELPFN